MRVPCWDPSSLIRTLDVVNGLDTSSIVPETVSALFTVGFQGRVASIYSEVLNPLQPVTIHGLGFGLSAPRIPCSVTYTGQELETCCYIIIIIIIIIVRPRPSEFDPAATTDGPGTGREGRVGERVTQCDGGEDSTCRSFNPLHCQRITESDRFLQLDARTDLDLMLVQSGLRLSSRLANGFLTN
ncbi:unnamed protein product [Pleuronectes platessa]|uniref:Uncharacterized protein n=1 Tax=Pleuronectes platessa TaxID=8262 RepID=A0A9N7VA68_PLEPL|nr:unnamed protein product [Pleuronectes platessa]